MTQQNLLPCPSDCGILSEPIQGGAILKVRENPSREFRALSPKPNQSSYTTKPILIHNTTMKLGAISGALIRAYQLKGLICSALYCSTGVLFHNQSRKNINCIFSENTTSLIQ